jgi:hypothetical protein
MTLAREIREKIDQFSEGEIFGYADLMISPKNFVSAAKVLERLIKKEVISKVSKGMFYKPESTVFGNIQPTYTELLRPYLFEKGRRIAYETGTTLYNRLGLTTQMAYRIKIACRGKRIKIKRGPIVADAVKSYAEVTDDNYEILGLLDAFKDIKKIPDCSVSQAVKRLSEIVKALKPIEKELLIKYALLYPPRVKALVGAILENEGYPLEHLSSLKNTINPLTIIKLGISEKKLPTKKN